MLAIAEAMSSEGKWHLAQYYVLKEMLKDLRAMASEWCDQCAMCTSTTSEEKMEAELEEKSGDEVGKSFWQWGLKDMVAWWKGEEQKVEKADQELAEMDEAEKKELLERMAGAEVVGVGNAAGGHPSLDHHPAGHPSVGGSAGQVESSLSRSFFQHMAQDLLESATVDAEMVRELHHAYRLVSSSTITAQFNLPCTQAWRARCCGVRPLVARGGLLQHWLSLRPSCRRLHGAVMIAIVSRSASSQL